MHSSFRSPNEEAYWRIEILGISPVIHNIPGKLMDSFRKERYESRCEQSLFKVIFTSQIPSIGSKHSIYGYFQKFWMIYHEHICLN